MDNQNRGEVLEKGEEIYFATLKSELEATHIDEYVAIDVDSGRHVIDKDKLQAIRKAQNAFGQKLFYLVQIGNLQKPTVNFRERKNVAWIFSQ